MVVPVAEMRGPTGKYMEGVLAFTFLYFLVLTQGWPELQNGAEDAEVKKPEKIICQYLSICRVLIPGAPGIPKSKDAQVPCIR